MRKSLRLPGMIGTLLFAALRAASAAPETDHDALMERARQALERKDLAAASEALERANELDPTDPAARTLAGVVLYLNGQPVEASGREFKRALQLCNGCVARKEYLASIERVTSAYRSREEQSAVSDAYARVEAGRAAEALPLLERAAASNPRSARIFYELGYAHVELRDIQRATAALEQARRINPVSAKVLAELQYCYAELRRRPELREVINDRIVVEGESARLYHELGYAFAVDGELDLAITTLEGSLRKFPDFLPSYYSLGQAWFEKGDAAKARPLLETFVARVEERGAERVRAELGRMHDLDRLLRDARKMIEEGRVAK